MIKCYFILLKVHSGVEYKIPRILLSIEQTNDFTDNGLYYIFHSLLTAYYLPSMISCTRGWRVWGGVRHSFQGQVFLS